MPEPAVSARWEVSQTLKSDRSAGLAARHSAALRLTPVVDFSFLALFREWCCVPLFSPTLDKNFSAAIDRNIRLCYDDRELNTVYIFSMQIHRPNRSLSLRAVLLYLHFCFSQKER